jgi:DNA-binding SARP family transcriptional activator
LLCLHGTAQLAAAPLAARESYSRAAQLADALGDAATRLRAAAGMIDSYLLEYSRVTEMDRWIEALECALQAEIDFPDADAELAVYGSLMTAINYRKMGSSFAGGCAARILALLEQATQAGVKLSAGVQAAVFQANTGQLDHAWRSLDALRAGLCDPGVTALPRALYWLTRLWCSILSADSQAGRAALAALDDIEQREGLRTAGLFAAAMGGAFELSHGTLGEAQRRLARLIALADPDNPYDTASRAMLESLTGVFTGDAQRALAHAPRAVELIDRMGSVMHRMGYRIPLVWAYTQIGREAEARHWIASVRAIQDETGTRFREPLLALAEAQLAKRRGEAQSKQERLGHALTVARIERCDHVFGRFRRWVGEPLSDALAAQIEPAHAKHLVRRYSIPAPREPCEDWPWRVKVYALGGFRVLVDGEARGFSRKQPRKPLALLKGLIALGGSGVPQARVQDALWPSEEGDSAHAACRMAVRRLRALLGEQELVSAQAGLLGLDLQRVWVDALEFERLVDDGAPFARLDALYRGVFLAQDLEAAWALPARQRLQRRFTQQLSAEARRREQAGDYEGAIVLYQRGIEMDEVAEALYLRADALPSAAGDGGGGPFGLLSLAP